MKSVEALLARIEDTALKEALQIHWKRQTPIQSSDNRLKPSFLHNCSTCIWLGWFEDLTPEKRWGDGDLYLCEGTRGIARYEDLEDHRDLLIRHSDDPSNYRSMPSRTIINNFLNPPLREHPLHEAWYRAHKWGVI